MTRKIRTALLAGIVALAAGGTAMAAAAERSHILKVALPDGSIQQIRYTGDVAPKIVVVPASAVAPIAMVDAMEADPFLEFDRIAAEMNRQTADMMQQVAALSAARPASANGKVDLAAFQNMPAGTVHYSFISTSNGKSVCSQSFEVTSQGPKLQPKMVSQSSSDCGAATSGVQPAVGHDAPAAPAVPTPVKAEGKAPVMPATRTGPTI